MEFTQEHDDIRRNVKQFIDDGDQPARRRVGGGRASSRRTRSSRSSATSGCSASTKPAKYGGMGLDYSYSVAMAEDARPHRLRRRADGDRRADRHGDAGARPLRLATRCAGVPRARRSPATRSPASASPSRAPAPTSPPSRPPRARTAPTTSSTAPRCGSPTACRPTGCACSPTPPKAPPHKNKTLICVPMNAKGITIARKIDKIGMMSSDTGADPLRRRARAAAQPHRRGRAWASPTR